MNEQISNLSLHKHNNLFAFLFFVLFIVVFSRAVYAYGFSVSPGIINLNLDAGEQGCSSFTVYDDNRIFSIEDKWASEKSNNVLDYMLNSSEVGVIADYDTDFYVDEDKKNSVCFRAYEKGVYQGVLLIRPYEKNAEIGVWVNLNVGDADEIIYVQKNESLLTGKIIAEDNNEDYSGTNDYSKILFFEFDFMFLMCLTLFFLLLKLKNKREQERHYF
jgi:hypothetical protein